MAEFLHDVRYQNPQKKKHGNSINYGRSILFVYIYIYIYTYLYKWTPKVCAIMACWAIVGGIGLLFYILLGSKYILYDHNHVQGLGIESHAGFSPPAVRREPKGSHSPHARTLTRLLSNHWETT